MRLIAECSKCQLLIFQRRRGFIIAPPALEDKLVGEYCLIHGVIIAFVQNIFFEVLNEFQVNKKWLPYQKLSNFTEILNLQSYERFQQI